MWTRRDYGIVAAAALATFGLTVGMFWPRLANAVDGKPAVTNDVKVPTLTMGNVQVTAQLDKDTPHQVVLTVKNFADEKRSASFKALAQVTPPTSPMSRGVRLSMPAWSSDYALDLKPGETKTLTVKLPDEAFTVASIPSQDEKASQIMRTTPGRSDLLLADAGSNGNTISALQLAASAVAAPAPAAPAAAAPAPVAATPVLAEKQNTP